MSIYLIKKQWGYQTCCPDEDNVVGYFKPENADTIQFYSKPSFDDNKLKKTKNRNHEQWKYNNADSCNMTLEKMDKKFGNIYDIEGSNILVGKSNPIWGWEEVKDKKNRITWIRVDQYDQIWAPLNDYNSDYEELNDNNNSDEDSSDEIKNLFL